MILPVTRQMMTFENCRLPFFYIDQSAQESRLLYMSCGMLFGRLHKAAISHGSVRTVELT